MSAEMTLPDVWKTLKLEDLFVHIIGGDWGKDPEIEDENFVHVLCIRGTEFRSWNKERGASAVLRKIKQSSLSSRKLEIGDILIEISGGGPDQPVGRTVVIDDRALKQHKSKSIVCTNFIRLARPITYVNPFYINYYLTAFYMSGEVINYQGGSNNLRNLKFKEYSQITVSLPPFSEQHQIAQRLDELLAQIDTIKARLDAIPSILKRFRQSVLSAAVSGKLTEEWRSLCGVSTDEWIKSCIGNLARVSTGKTPKRTEMKYWSEGNIPWLTSACTGTSYTEQAKQFVTELAVKKCGLKMFEPGTLLLAMYGEGKTRGQISELRIKATCNQACATITVDEISSIRSFIKLCLLENYEKTREVAVGGAQPNLNLEKVREIPIHLPPKNEQIEIVRRVDHLFTFADQIEQRVNDAKSRVDKLTQSILAKAFRGELTADWRTEHPELISGENSAEALLAKIQAAKEALGGKKKKGKAA